MKILLCFIMFTISTGNVRFKPIVYLSHLSKASDSFYDKRPISVFGAGIEFHYYRDKFKIDAKFLNQRLWGISIQEKSQYNSFNNIQGISWGQDSNKSGKSFDYDFADLEIIYILKNIKLIFGKINPMWGEGYSKLMFSDKTPSFPLFGFNWKVKDDLLIDYLSLQMSLM